MHSCFQAFQDYFVTEAYYENNSFFGKGDKMNLQRYSWMYQYNNTIPEQVVMSWDQIFKSKFRILYMIKNVLKAAGGVRKHDEEGDAKNRIKKYHS